MAWGGRRAQALVRLVLDTYGTRCWLDWDEGCTRTATTADHVLPRSQGGDDSLDNMRPACLHCNSARGAKPLSARPRRVEAVEGLSFFSDDGQDTPRQPVHFSPTTQKFSDSQPDPDQAFTFWLGT